MSSLAAELFRLSPQQRRIWTLAPGGAGPLRALARVRVEGALDRGALEAALAAVAGRHEILRTTFPVPEGMSVPGQAVHEEAAPALQSRDFSGLAAEEQAAALDALWDELAARPFHPDREPPWVAVLARLGPESHRLFLAAHALCADEKALGVLADNLGEAYASLASLPSLGSLPSEEPPVQYADVAAALEEMLESEETGAGRAYWREILPAAPAETLPFEREAAAPFEPRRVEAEIDPALAEPIRALAAWQALLAGLAPEPGERVIGVELSGRHYEGFETALGPFARTVPVRAKVRGEEPFSALAARLAEPVAALADWQDYFSWEGVTGSEEGIFPAVFRFEDEKDGRDGKDRKFLLEESWACTDRFRLKLAVRERGGIGRAELAYDAARFREPEARTLLASWLALLQSASTGPETPIGDLDRIGPADRRRLAAWNDTARPFEPAPVHELFQAQALRTPEAPALSTFPAGLSLTYAELARRVTALAARLREAGAGTDVPVALFAERSVEMVAGALAILEAGGAYLPLDPAYPASRLSLILETSGAPILLAPAALQDRLPLSAVQIVPLDDEGWRRPSPGGEGVRLEEGTGVRAFPESAAYLLFTSGSTGTPKGVVVRHRALTNHMLWMQEAYPLAPGDRVLQKTPLGFDASVWELFAPLLAGAELVLAEPDAHRDPARLARATAESGATALQVVPSLLRLLLGEAAFADCAALRRLYCGGEPLSAELRDRVHALLPRAELINLYGPTETTVQVASWVAERGNARPGETVPIGRPIHNARIHVLDAGLRPLPPGLPGELWIGGEALARGYLGRPDLTAAAFRPDPFGAEPGARLYRTGDLGRHRLEGDDGALEMLGRAGRETKVRGYRFDPGEIEDLLGQEETVREAAVVVREDRPGEQRLIAYVVPRGGAVDAPALRARLAERLPDFLVPSAFVPLPALPRTASGKLDRNALPEAEPSSQPSSPSLSSFSAPRTPVEELLAAIWADLLGRPRVGLHDDFFELGGHSLLGARLVARIREALGVELSLRTVFETPTVAGLAAQVEDARRAGSAAAPMSISPIARVPRAGDLPLSFAQRRLWFLDRLAPGNPDYNGLSAVQLTGRLDERALLGAFREIVRVQESLRTTFFEVEGRPVQRPAPALDLELPLVDLTGLPAAARRPEAHRLAGEEARRPFDLAAGPLLRLALLRLEADRSVLLTGVHHIVSDAWSVALVYRDLMALYTAAVSGRPFRLPEPPVQYADYAVWQRRWFEEAREAELAWWRARLADLPALALPTDHPRSAQPSSRALALPFVLPAGTTAALRRRARTESVTPFLFLLAVFQALLHRWSGQDEVVAGSPVANRDRAEIEGLVGFFVNTLVLPASFAGDPPLRELLARVREGALGAYAHQSAPFEALVEELAPERDLTRQPLFQVMFQLQTVPWPRFTLPGVEVEGLEIEPASAPFDLSLDLREIAQEGAEPELRGVLLARADLFEAPTLHRFLGHLRTLLTAASSEEAAAVRVSGLALLSPAERHQIALEWNDNARPYEEDRSIHELFAEQAARTPDAEALAFADAHLTYAELEARANRLARQLLRRGLGPEARVALLLESSADWVTGLLAILKAGGAYVPLDPAVPEARSALLLRESGAAVLIVRSRAELPAALADAPVLVLSEEAEEIARQSPAPLPALAAPRGLAYVLFTSGSTGKPKGVAIPHRAVVRLVRGSGMMPIGPGDRVIQSSNVAFDAGTYEVWGSLLSGAALAGVPRDVLVSPRDLAAWLRRERISLFLAPASLFHQVARAAPDAFRTVRLVASGGEALDPKSAREVLAASWPGDPADHLFNDYGPTEATCVVISWPVHDIPAGARSVPLGRPLGNTRLAVLDRHLQPVPIGVEGELCIGGEALARGYLGQPGLTAERFVPDPAGGGGARLYRTGDRARFLPDGRLDFLGRLDTQVKIRGFRIEPGEVETALAAHPDVAAAVVLADGEGSGRRLVAFVVPANGLPASLDLAGLRDVLRGRLPDSMVPAAIVPLAALPLTHHDKVDRAALAVAAQARPAADRPAGTSQSGEGFQSPIEEGLAGIWADALGVAHVGRDDDFFELSGHSLLAAQVAYRIRRAFGVDLPLRRFFERATVAELAAEIERGRHAGEEAAPPLPPLEPAPRDRPIPASFYQELGWRVQGGPVSARSNIPRNLRLRGRLDVAALRQSFAALAERHEALRTNLRQEGDALFQEVHPPFAFPVLLIDLSALPEGLREAVLQDLLLEEGGRPFDLRVVPLLRAFLYRLEEADHALAMTLHHAMGDGWSLQLIERELTVLYGAFLRGLPSPLPPLRFHYADFAWWQRRVLEGAPIEAQLAWWRRRLAGAPPPPDLPSRRPRPARLGLKALQGASALSPGPAAAVRALARAEGCTVSMVLLAGLAALFNRYTGGGDLLIATVLAGRSRPELTGVVGLLINTVPLRADLSGAPGFRELLARVREEVLESSAHQDVSFPRLFMELFPQHGVDRSAVFRVAFNMLDFLAVPEKESPAALPLAIEGIPSAGGPALYDLVLSCLEDGEVILCGWTASADLFDLEDLDLIGEDFEALMTQATADPDAPLDRLLPVLRHRPESGR